MEANLITHQDINIVYEDNHILVAVKPRNLPVCADESGDKDLLSLLKEYLVEKYNKPGQAYLGLVHRLDRPTGGVIVFAKTTKAAGRLAEAFKEHRVEKKYVAVVSGVPKEKSAELVHYLWKDLAKHTVYSVPMATEGAKKAVLSYKTLETKDVKGSVCSLLTLNLETGRAHQIRVQMATVGNPLYGDQKYGGAKAIKGEQLALWAYSLKFTHPVTGEIMAFRVYPPEEERPWNAFDINRYLTISIKN